MSGDARLLSTPRRALSKHEEVTALLMEPPALRERRELQEWIAETKTDCRYLHDVVCEAVHKPSSKHARHAQVMSALEAARSGSSAAATAAIMNVAVAPVDTATLASRELEKRLRKLVFEDEDELLSVVRDTGRPGGSESAAMRHTPRALYRAYPLRRAVTRGRRLQDEVGQRRAARA